MTVSDLAGTLASFLDLGWLGYVVVFLFAVGEAVPLLGFVVPGQWVVVAAGFAAQQGYYSLAAVLAVVIAGGIVGDAVGYHAGRTHGRATLEKWGPRVKLDPSNVGLMQDFLEDYGPVALILARFTMVTRSLGPHKAGQNAMPRHVLWPVYVGGAVLWGATYTLLGYVFGTSTELLARAIGGTAIVVAVFGAGALLVAYLLARHRRHKRTVLGVLARRR